MTFGDVLSFFYSPVYDHALDQAGAEGPFRKGYLYHFLNSRSNLVHPNNLTLSHFFLLLGVYVDSHMIEVFTKHESTTLRLRVLNNLTRREHIQLNILVEDHMGVIEFWWIGSIFEVTVELIHAERDLFEV